MKTIIAIDPGVNGGLAGYTEGAAVFTNGFSTMTQMDIIHVFKDIRQRTPKDQECIAVMEDIARFIQAMPAASMSVYAESFGVLKGALMALGFKLIVVRAQKWQKDLALFPVKRPKTKHGLPVMKNGKQVMEKDAPEWKRTLRAKAQELFPEQATTLQNADALLILEWAKRTGVGA